MKSKFTNFFPDPPKPSSAEPVMKENTEIIRKRRPINFTLDDLKDDENGDENFKVSAKTAKNAKKSPDTNSADR